MKTKEAAYIMDLENKVMIAEEDRKSIEIKLEQLGQQIDQLVFEKQGLQVELENHIRNSQFELGQMEKSYEKLSKEFGDNKKLLGESEAKQAILKEFYETNFISKDSYNEKLSQIGKLYC